MWLARCLAATSTPRLSDECGGCQAGRNQQQQGGKPGDAKGHWKRDQCPVPVKIWPADGPRVPPTARIPRRFGGRAAAQARQSIGV